MDWFTYVFNMCSIQLNTFMTIVLVLQTFYYDHVAHLWTRAPVEAEDLFPQVSALGVLITYSNA